MLRVSDKTYKWLTVATVGAGILSSTLDGSIVNIAYPILTDVFDTEASTILWVTVAYLIVSATLALPLGSVGDLLGRKRLFVGGFIVFTIGLVLVTISQTIGQLIGFRILQGIGQGMMLAISNALIVSAFPDHERGRALGINGAMVGIGLASGPVIGGFILMIGLSSLLLLINRAPIDGFSNLVIGLSISTAVSLPLFFLAEQRTNLPIFDFGLLKQRIFAMAVTSSLLHFIAQSAFLFLMPFYLLQGLGMKPIEAGPLLMTLQITRLVFSPLSGFLSDRYQSRTISTFGLIIMASGYGVLMNLDTDSSIVIIIFGLFLAGCGSSTFLPPNNNVVMGSVGRERIGMVSAVIPVVRQVGLSGYADGFAVALMFVLIAIVTSASRGLRPLPRDTQAKIITDSRHKDDLR